MPLGRSPSTLRRAVGPRRSAPLLVALLAMSCSERAAQEATAREQPTAALLAIEELHRRDRQASLAGDHGALLDLATEDVVLLPPDGEPIVGRQQLQEMLQADRAAAGEGAEVVDYVQDFVEVAVHGDLAYEWGTYRGTYRLASGAEISTGGKLLRVLRREPDGSFRVARSIWTVDD